MRGLAVAVWGRMNTLMHAAVSVTIMLSASGCSSQQPTPASAPIALKARVSVGDAIPKLAAAECDRAARCKAIGESLEFSSVEHCTKVKSDELGQDFNTDQDCKNGISSEDLNKCMQTTRDRTCEGLSSVVGDVERASVCGSAELCMD